MNTRLFLIGMPNDDLAKRVGNDAFDDQDGGERAGACRGSRAHAVCQNEECTRGTGQGGDQFFEAS